MYQDTGMAVLSTQANHDRANQAMFLGDVGITGGTYHYTGEGGVTNYYNSRKGLGAFETLKGHVVTGALHNSGEVSDPPKCHPGTRVAILEVLVQWALSPEYPFLVKWLHGPAGAGKSAIMRTLAETLSEKGLLIASFFLSRTGANHNSPQSLIPTIAYQLCLAIPSTRVHIERAIDKNPLIFQLSLSAQAQALITHPLIAAQRELTQEGTAFGSFKLPRVIILDGLDECEGQDAQREILQVLCDCIHKLPVPLALLVASRPEHHIRAAFDLGQLNQWSSRIALDDSFEPDADIERFFLDNFTVIKQSHPSKQYLPSPWPPDDAINVLVQKASGQFIYADTVVKFISPIRYNPIDRLAIILGARDPGTLKPFEQLDLLYTTIFLMINQEELPSTLRVLGALMTPPTAARSSNRSILSPAFLESLLGLKCGEIRRLLFDLESLLSVTDDLVDIRIFHASLSDFIFDKSRSKQFFIDKGMIYEGLARRCLRLFTSKYDHYLECYLVDHTRSYFEKATPTIELYRAITHTDILRLAKLSVQSGHKWIIYGLRRLVPVFLRAVQQSKFPDASILYSNHLQSYRKYLKLKLSPYLNGNRQTICLILAAIHLRDLPSKNLADFLNVAGLGLSEDHHRIDSDGLQILRDYNMKGELSITTFVSDVLGSKKLAPDLWDYYTDFAIYLMKCISRGSGFYVHNEESIGPNTPLSFGLYVVDILPGIMRNSPVREGLTTLVEDLQATLHYRQAYCALDHAMNNYISRKRIVEISENQQPGEDLQHSQHLRKKAVLANSSTTAVIAERPNVNRPSVMHSTAKRTVGAQSPAIGKGPPSQRLEGPKPKPPPPTNPITPQPAPDIPKTTPGNSESVPKPCASSYSKGPPGTFTPKPNPHASKRLPRKELVPQPKNEDILVDSDDPLVIPDRTTNFTVRKANAAPIRSGQRQGGHTRMDLHPGMNPSSSRATTAGKVADHILPALVPSIPSAVNTADTTEPVSEVKSDSTASWVEVRPGDGLGEDSQSPTSLRQRAFMKVDRFFETAKSGKGKMERKRTGNEESPYP